MNNLKLRPRKLMAGVGTKNDEGSAIVALLSSLLIQFVGEMQVKWDSAIIATIFQKLLLVGRSSGDMCEISLEGTSNSREASNLKTIRNNLQCSHCENSGCGTGWSEVELDAERFVHVAIRVSGGPASISTTCGPWKRSTYLFSNRCRIPIEFRTWCLLLYLANLPEFISTWSFKFALFVHMCPQAFLLSISPKPPWWTIFWY